MACWKNGSLVGFCQFYSPFFYWDDAYQAFITCMAMQREQRSEILFSLKKCIFEAYKNNGGLEGMSYWIPLMTEDIKIEEMRALDKNMKEKSHYVWHYVL